MHAGNIEIGGAHGLLTGACNSAHALGCSAAGVDPHAYLFFTLTPLMCICTCVCCCGLSDIFHLECCANQLSLRHIRNGSAMHIL